VGTSLTPLLSLSARVGVGQISSADSLSLAVTSAETALSHYAPAVRLESEVAVGLVRRGSSAGSELTGRVRAGVRLPRHVTLRLTLQRDPYFHTMASVRTVVMTRSLTTQASMVSPDGWLGEAAVQQTTYPDDNATRTLYAWLLAPLVQAGRGRLSLGYGVTAQDATENRFVLAQPHQQVPPSNPHFVFDGRYEPYYTPATLVVHSVLASGEVRTGRATLRAGGSYGVRATDKAPVFTAPAVVDSAKPDAVERTFVSRSFSPWNARASVEVATSMDLTLGLSGESTRTAFYTATTARAWLTYRFAGAAIRRAAGR
jgi:hypothetical protein